MKLFQPIQGSIESKETQENLIDRGQLQVNIKVQSAHVEKHT